MASGTSGTDRQWPPRSPREALLSTPGGRQRYQRMLDRTSPSPSPSRKSRSLFSSSKSAPNMLETEDATPEDGDEDEETLQLKLQEIQARLRLKKLQAAKAKGDPAVRDATSRLESAASNTDDKRHGARRSSPSGRQSTRPFSQASIQVPASPVRKVQEVHQQTSPSRVLLGIDKGLTAKDVSLKRAPSQRSGHGARDGRHNDGYLRRSKTPNPSLVPQEISRPLSFNERLASSRSEETTRAERRDRVNKVRTNAFGIGKEEMDMYKKAAVDIPDEPLAPPTFSREDVLQQNKPASNLRRSNTVPSVRTVPDKAYTEDTTTKASKVAGEESSVSFESYSTFHLSRRNVPHQDLTRHIKGKQLYSIKDLLKVVKAPDFSLPDIEQDIVVFAIVAKKSEPRAHKPGPNKNGAKAEDRGKYMVISLTDLDFEIDLFLFDSGFMRFWKLTEGTVIAILNPNLMPPPPGRTDTGRFSLIINSDMDTIIEIGSARDLGFCQTVKKDGSLCGSWVNKKKTQFCEYHSNEAIRKQRATRVEVNGSDFGPQKDGRRKAKEGFSQFKRDRDWDRESQSHVFATRSMSAADLIDGKDRGLSDKRERAEFLKRSLEAKEKERDMMKKLGRIGNAAGKEYMQRAGSRTDNSLLPSSLSAQLPTPSGSSDSVDKPDVKTLGLQSRDRTVHLSPVKRKRADSSQTSSTAAFGWGGGLKDKLSRMKEGEKLRKDEQPPQRKKTRFVTEKGIRVAGRESLGGELGDRRQIALDNDEDDDELVILK